MGILDGKRLLITGVLTDASLAFAVARLAQEEGAEVVLTGAGRGLSLTRRTARKLPTEPEVLEFDVTSPEQAEAVQACSKRDGAGLTEHCTPSGSHPRRASVRTSWQPTGMT